jgi:hypothetical protein
MLAIVNEQSQSVKQDCLFVCIQWQKQELLGACWRSVIKIEW